MIRTGENELLGLDSSQPPTFGHLSPNDYSDKEILATGVSHGISLGLLGHSDGEGCEVAERTCSHTPRGSGNAECLLGTRIVSSRASL